MAIQTLQEIARELLKEASDAAFALFGNAVRPIYGVTNKSDPYHIGSAVLLYLEEGHFLLTAAHVLDENAHTSLYLGANNFVPLKFDAMITKARNGDRDKDHADFAMAHLDPDLVSKLSGVKFITEAEISRSVAATIGRTYTCLGYPNSKNKPNPYKSTKVKPCLAIYTSRGKPVSQLPKIATDHDHILVDHDAQYSRDENGAKVQSIALRGFSGGAIIDLGRISVETLTSGIEPRFAALVIEGHPKEKVILGTRLTTILGAIRKHLQGLASATCGV